MRSHEGYEEHKLYPFLERRWNVSFKAAEAGHHELHDRYDKVIEAFTRLRISTDDAEREGEEQTLIQALQNHDRVLRQHLELEEDLVIPLLLELSPEEFELYCNSSISTLLRAFK